MNSDAPRLIGQLPFVGRAADLTELSDVVLGGGRALVVGAPGLGKSRLLQELTDNLADRALMLHGECPSHQGHSGYWAWREIAENARHHLPLESARLSDTARRHLAPFFPLSSAAAEQSNDPQALWLAWGAYLDELAKVVNSPLGIVIEDVHQADDDTVGLTHWLSRRQTTYSLIVSSRPAVPEPLRDLPTLLITELSVDTTAELLDRAGNSTSAVDLHRDSGGVPLRMRDWLHTSAIYGSERATLNQLASQLEPLPAETVEVLETAAMFIGPFELAVLGPAMHRSLDELHRSLSPAIELGLIDRVGSGTSVFDFHHDLHRDVVRRRLDAGARAAIHSRILDALSTVFGDDPSQVSRRAHHATMSAYAGSGTQALGLNLAAGRRAMTALAPATAERHFGLAVELAEAFGTSEQRLESLLELGLSQRMMASVRAEETLRQVLELAEAQNDRIAFAHAALALPTSEGGIGLAMRGNQRVSRLLASVEPDLADQPALHVAVLCEQALQGHADLSEREFLELIDRAEAIASPLGDPTLDATVLISRYCTRRTSEPVELIVRRALQLLDQVPDTDPTIVLGLFDLAIVQSLRQGDLDAAEGLIAALSSRIHPPPPVAAWTLLRIEAAIAHARGDITQAEALAVEAAQSAEQTRHSESVGVYFGFQIAACLRERRDFATASAAIDSWVEEHPGYLAFRAGRAWQRSDAGDDQQALRDLDVVFAHDLEAQRSFADGLPTIAMAALAAVNCNHDEYCAESLRLLAPFEHQWIVVGAGTLIEGPVQRILGLCAAVTGDIGRALQWNEAAASASKVAGAHLYEWHTTRDRGHILRIASRHADAAVAYHAAAANYRAGGLTEFAEYAEGLAAELGTMTEVATTEVPTIEPEQMASTNQRGIIDQRGTMWRVELGGEEALIPDLKGVPMLAALLENPHRRLHVTELSAVAEGASAAEGGLLSTEVDVAESRQPVLDAEALRAYRARLDDLTAAIAKADRAGDPEKSEQLAQEHEFLVEELRRASGLGGRQRELDKSTERVRVRVTKAIRSTIRRIRSVAPTLGAHLDGAIQTGSFCSYEPDPLQPVSWGPASDSDHLSP